MSMQKSLIKELANYLLPSMLAVMGTSLYVLADSFFIAQAEGTNGIAALNLSLPMYAINFGIGGMIGIGSATRYSLQKARGAKDIDFYFTNSILWNLLIGLCISLLFGLFTDHILIFLGANAALLKLASPYMRIAMILAPFAMINISFTAFIRNDHDPKIAMMATLLSGLFNIVMDWWLIFPLHLGMAGAALATAFSPFVSMCICSIHFFHHNNHLIWQWKRPSLTKLRRSISLGTVILIGEMASGITTIVFNYVLLSLQGNIAVAAYGIIANCALVIIAIDNGIAQGQQPLVSNYFGAGEIDKSKKICYLSSFFGFLLSLLIIAFSFIYIDDLIAIFNREQNSCFYFLAKRGIYLYFIGFLISVLNIILAGYFSAIGLAKESFWISMLRGTILICFFALSLPKILGIDGVWLSFLAAETVTLFVTIFCLHHLSKKGPCGP